MKNKFILLVCSCICILALAGCGSSSSSTTAAATGSSSGAGNETATAAANTGSTSGYTFTYNNVSLYIGEDASVIDQLGEYKDYSESSSCAFEGLDKQYYYGSFYVTTGTLDGKDIITGYWLADDTVSTDEGLYIGDGKDSVEAIYGSDGYNGTNAYILDKDNCELQIIMDTATDTVQDISYVYTK